MEILWGENMKVLVNIPFYASREYVDDFDEKTIPDVGERFDGSYIVANKTMDGDTCILDLKRDR